MTGRTVCGLACGHPDSAVGAITRELPFARALVLVLRAESCAPSHHVDVFYRTLERHTTLIAQQVAFAVTFWLGELHEDYRPVWIVLLGKPGGRGREIVGEHRRE